MAQSMGETVENLIKAIDVVMDPYVSKENRVKAQELCEDFRENSPEAVECGFMLADRQYKPYVRHFGLQLVDHSIKFLWNSLSAEKKVFIKEATLQYMMSGTNGILEEELYVKDGISRIIVEMAKREWPQQWPSFIDELEKVAQVGAAQTELVLLVWLRLAEDTVTLQTIPSQRRRDIYSSLVSNMGRLMGFSLTCLQLNVDKYRQLRNASPSLAAVHCHLSKSVLTMLCGFLDWISIDVITGNNNLLLQMLCLLLSDSELQYYAAECLLYVVNRKGKTEERKPLLVLFCTDAMQAIFLATEEAAFAKLDEYHYQFMKKLTQVLTGIGSQLTVLWGSDSNLCRPENFDKYLDAILALAGHPSQMLASYTQILIHSFLRHDLIKEDHELLQRLETILNICMSSLLKVGHPSHSNHPSCAYSLIDFDCDEDFNAFFCRYRAEATDTVRLVTLLRPSLAFKVMSSKLDALLKKPVAADSQCSLTSPSYLDWEAMTIVVESVMSRLTRDANMTSTGVALLKGCLYYCTKDQLLLSCILSFISALFTFLNDAAHLLPVALEKVFACAVFNPPGQTKSTRSRRVKNLRRHACSVLVKVCKEHPALLLPTFDQLHHHIHTLMSDPEQLSTMEKCTLNESLVLISNHFCQFDKQTSFIQEVLQPVRTVWLSPQFTTAFQSTRNLMSFIGLDSAPVEPSSADSCGISRSRVLYCMCMIQAVMKRSKCPDDPELAQSGGFVLDVLQSNGATVCQNPATQHIRPLLENLLMLAKSFNALWLPENLALRHPEFASAFELPEVEKRGILGVPAISSDDQESSGAKTPLERMQNFIVKTIDTIYRILSEVGHHLGYQLYHIPELTSMLLQTALSTIDVLPDYHLRNIIRLFLKYHLLNCPSELYQSDALPILSRICPFMHTKLAEQWQLVNQRCEAMSQQDDEVDPESQEILEEQLTRRLTRDYLDFLGSLILRRVSKFPTVQETDAIVTGETTMESDEPAPSSGQSQNSSSQESMTTLGLLLLADNALCTPVVLTIFNALSWNDTVTCHKSLTLCWHVFKQLMKQQLLSSDEGSYLLTCVFLGLQLHGQHESIVPLLVTLAMQMYDTMVPVFPNVTQLLQQIPTYNEKTLKSYHDMSLHVVAGKSGEKKCKDMFKKLVSGIIGKSIGQQFKRDIDIKNLPKMFTNRRRSSPLVDQVHDSVGLHTLFGPTGEGGSI